MSHIRWTDEEVRIIAQRFVELRFAQPLAESLTLLLEAQGELDPNRQRPINTIGAFKRIIEIVPDTWARRLRTYASAGPSPANAPVAPLPPPPKPPVAPTPAEAAPAAIKPGEPLLIEIRAEKSDPNAALQNCPTPLLFGYALERLLSLRTAAPISAAPPTQTVLRVEATTPIEPPTVIQADRVIETKRPRDVIVLGMLRDAVAVLKTKLPPLDHLRLNFIESGVGSVTVPGTTPCDYLVLTGDLVTKFQSEQIRRRLGATASKRVFHFDGTQNDLLQHLKTINDQEASLP